MKTVTAAEANRNFSALLRDVARGERVLVTSRGKPVATIIPPEQPAHDPTREQARRALFERLQSQPISGVPRDWTRDELYER
ncbi:MAG: type II toxin-antitoxin system Phd/YefM family antitoxin [Rubrivivax sp.]|nr:type II toxin-antitoxin system Phd/YefM family antitoxin [Rubrivivax sp.]